MFFFLFTAVTACVSVTDAAQPEAETNVCYNDIKPAKFRLVLKRTDGTIDTTPVFVNRYAIPHRSADTLHLKGNGGEAIRWILGWSTFDGNHCRLLSDSMATWAPGDSYLKRITVP